MYPYYYYRVSNWGDVLNLLQQSLFAEKMVCAMSSELFHIPATKDLEGNRQMHDHLVPASYHLLTATGSAQRLINGEDRQSIIDTLVACINNAQDQNKKVRVGLSTMLENASQEYKPFIDLIIKWQNQKEAYLSQAKDTVRSMGISFTTESNQQNGGNQSY
ncbi:hypothetical protein HNQ94_000150 [Salirhabdus euzebyi]|uniref:Uncharacterized protein n=1 Tax=Salirhabdus euzebyi TaxID=394506 RepID=A0A841PSE3_9BACI|nr:hypothetical protein [Salirhabdus euzebyi]MBB6451729.1 hypothetical protein [Salirhabdus euzebyi]